MDYRPTTFTWFWLYGPTLAIIVLSVVNFARHKGGGRQ